MLQSHRRLMSLLLLCCALIFAGTPVTALASSRHGKMKRISYSKRVIVDPLDAWTPNVAALPPLRANVALVMDLANGEVLLDKNSRVQLPIASITKLMTAVVVLDSRLLMNEPLTIAAEDVDFLRHSTSHLQVGTTLVRSDVMRLALMASENRAAAALARNYPGGTAAFVARMNRKALSLGMTHTHFDDPTGLSNGNYATAQDLARLVAAAGDYDAIRNYTTSAEFTIYPLAGQSPRSFHNTNPLVKSASWEILVSKTGFTNEAGKCLVMKAKVGQHPVVIVLLDSAGGQSRIADANRVRKWLEQLPAIRNAIANQEQPREAPAAPTVAYSS